MAHHAHSLVSAKGSHNVGEDTPDFQPCTNRLAKVCLIFRFILHDMNSKIYEPKTQHFYNNVYICMPYTCIPPKQLHICTIIYIYVYILYIYIYIHIIYIYILYIYTLKVTYIYIYIIIYIIYNIQNLLYIYIHILCILYILLYIMLYTYNKYIYIAWLYATVYNL